MKRNQNQSQTPDSTGEMEAETVSKNAAIPKSQTGRWNTDSKNRKPWQWATEGLEITPENISELLYENDSVKQFLYTDGKYFIIAEKGLGKTLLLAQKRYTISKKMGILPVPSDAPYIDMFSNDLDFIDKNTKESLGSVKLSKSLWIYAIRLSAIKYYDRVHSLPVDVNKLSNISAYILHNDALFNPCLIIEDLLHKNLSSVLNSINSDAVELAYLFGKIQSSVYFFIDRLDQNMNECPREMWIAMQAGLIEAAWDLVRNNNHIKTFCSIRKEAFLEYRSPNKQALSGCVCNLNYRNDELHDLINRLSEYYENRTIEQIVGFDTFQHPKTNLTETAFSYILRHTVFKPRDLVDLASVLQEENISQETTKEKKIDKFRSCVNKKATSIAEKVFAEDTVFLDSIKDETDRETFLSLIFKNTLKKDAMKRICQKFNQKYDCSENDCQNNNACKHPFCELYNVGLLGYVNNKDVPCKQVFKDPYEKGKKHIVDCYEYYVVHPCLNKYKYMSPGYIITEGITAGNGYLWGERETKISDLIDYVLQQAKPEEKNRALSSIRESIRNQKPIDAIVSEVTASLSKKHTAPAIPKIPNENRRKPRQGNEIHVLFASPNDVSSRKLFLSEFEAYFRRQYTDCKYRLIIDGFEDVPTATGYAQDVINEYLIDKKTDIVLAVFKHKLGAPVKDKTGSTRAPSGTAEELLKAINGDSNSSESKPLGMAYFCAKSPSGHADNPSFRQKMKEWSRIEKFKKEIKDKIYYKLYEKDTKEELFPLIARELFNNIKTHFK